MNTNIVELIYKQAQIQPDRPAIITDQSVITYNQLSRLIGIIARYLKDQGIGPGEIVGVSMAYNPRHLMALLALAQIGAVSLPLPPSLPKEQRLLAAHRFGATRILSGRRDWALERMGFVDISELFWDEKNNLENDFIQPVTPDSPMRIIISSGTSGNPKGMVLTHGAMALRSQTTEAGFTKSSRIMPMDINFIVGFRPAMSALINGAVLVFPASMMGKEIMHGMINHKVTHVYFSPMQARDMAAQARKENTTCCPDLVSLRIGGGPVSAEVLQAVRTSLTPNIYVSYGSTESGLITYATPEMILRQPGTVGRVCPWATVEIVGQDNQPLPPERVGQIRIRSDHQVAGYYCDEEHNSLQFRAGWFYPGDLGHFDADGLLYIEGRIDEQINLEGNKINPVDVESVLSSHSAVLDSACFVASSGGGGKVLTIALVLTDPSHLDEVKAYVHQKLDQTVPMRYVFAASLPRTETGKLKRGELAELVLND